MRGDGDPGDRSFIPQGGTNQVEKGFFQPGVGKNFQVTGQNLQAHATGITSFPGPPDCIGDILPAGLLGTRILVISGEFNLAFDGEGCFVCHFQVLTGCSIRRPFLHEGYDTIDDGQALEDIVTCDSAHQVQFCIRLVECLFYVPSFGDIHSHCKEFRECSLCIRDRPDGPGNPGLLPVFPETFDLIAGRGIPGFQKPSHHIGYGGTRKVRAGEQGTDNIFSPDLVFGEPEKGYGKFIEKQDGPRAVDPEYDAVGMFYQLPGTFSHCVQG